MVAAVTSLPNGCGLIYRVMGMQSQAVKRRVREFCSLVRLTVKCRPMADDFPWR
jgi:urease accessory protein